MNNGRAKENTMMPFLHRRPTRQSKRFQLRSVIPAAQPTDKWQSEQDHPRFSEHLTEQEFEISECEVQEQSTVDDDDKADDAADEDRKQYLA